MPKVVLSEQQRRILHADRATSCEYMLPPLQNELRSSRKTTSSRRPTSRRSPRQYQKGSYTYTELKTWFDNKCFNVQDISKASNIMTSRHVHTCKFVKNEKSGME
eukprot:3373609-Pyramimonas_sp.AAC.2